MGVYMTENIGQIVKVERFTHHLVASKTAPKELDELNTIENLQDIYTSMRTGGLSAKESKLSIENTYNHVNEVPRLLDLYVPPVNPDMEIKTYIEGFKNKIEENKKVRTKINAPFNH